jgi:alpha-lytic protease prodomain-containing protein
MIRGTRTGMASAGMAALLISVLTPATARASIDPAGPDVVGSYLDHGRLVVTVSDAGAADRVRRAGAEPRLVRNPAAALSAVMTELDDLARAGKAGRARSWYVDPVSGTVVVKVEGPAVPDAVTRGFLGRATARPGLVTVTHVAGTLTKTSALLGGHQVDLSNGYVCSVGFNARAKGGTPIFFTAGHCARDYPDATRNAYTLGTTRVSRYPGDDWGAVNITNAAWVQRGQVERWTQADVAVRGWSNAPVGSPLCKAGRTTRWTCGTISARNVSVNYGDELVTGLYEHTACVEGGDSGGPNLSGNLAQGVTSGAALIGGLCLQKHGRRNESLSQPIGEALTASGASLVLG